MHIKGYIILLVEMFSEIAEIRRINMQMFLFQIPIGDLVGLCFFMLVIGILGYGAYKIVQRSNRIDAKLKLDASGDSVIQDEPAMVEKLEDLEGK